MSSGDVAVASPEDVLHRRSSTVTPSRRSIISKITLGDQPESPVSNTDAVLRNRRPSTSGSGNSKQQDRRRSKSGSNGAAAATNGTAAIPALNLPLGDGASNG